MNSSRSNMSQRFTGNNNHNRNGCWQRMTSCCRSPFDSIKNYFSRFPTSCVCCCYRHGHNRPGWLNRIYDFTKSPIWKILYVFFSLFLLFGAAIQYLAVDATGDIVFEIIRNTMLAFFVIDMIIRCVTDHDYFVCTLCCRNNSSSGMLMPPHATSGSINSLAYVDSKEESEPFAIGSFLFWCDLISTMAILFDLSYINPNAYGIQEVDIGLDGDGVPTSGFDVYRRLRPVEIEFNLLVVIARSARCARFVQHRAVVGASNKINWFWICNMLKWLNPFFYVQRFRSRRYQARMSAANLGSDTATFASTTTGGGSVVSKKSSWSALHIGVLAAVHAQHDAEQSNDTASSSNKNIWSKLKKGMQFFGLARPEASATERHAAAIKIQRAWRNFVRFESAMSIDGDNLGDMDFMMDASNQSSQKERYRTSSSSFSRARAKGRLVGRQSMAPESRFQSQAGKGRESQVGSDMRELTGQRVALGTLLALVCTVLFTYTESSTTWPTAMVVLHKQTMFTDFQTVALESARNTALPELYMYQPVDGSTFDLADDTHLRDRDKLVITVSGMTGTSVGWFDYQAATQQSALVDIVSTLFIIVFWFFGVTAFSGPVMLLVKVFVFTNRIAAVVHSICHSYGGAANKNIGDAFLLSWSLEDQSSSSSKPTDSDDTLKATSNQADKALLSVIKICISLWYDKFYLEPLTETARGRLKAKLKRRSGPVVQMGFGLHAGKAVQGAIGSQRKIDATFHSLLHPSTKRRCRMIDKVFIVDEDEDADEDDDELHGERMDLYTFDMDVAEIHRPYAKSMKKIGEYTTLSDGGSVDGELPRVTRTNKGIQRRSHGSDRQMIRNRRRSTNFRPGSSSALGGVVSEDFLVNTSSSFLDNGNLTSQPSVSSVPSEDNNTALPGPPELVLPTGPALYSHNVWKNPEMNKIRDKFVQGLFFKKFDEGLQAYYRKDWDTARNAFQCVLDSFDDGPSKYFMAQMEQYGGVPPRDFRPYGIV